MALALRLVRSTIMGLVLVSFALASKVHNPSSLLVETVASLSHQDEATILITDSGLGGLSVVAGIEHRLRQCPLFARARLVFANALISTDRPYNHMSSMQEKAVVFSNALDGFVARYQPDMILIACNTLSVVYPNTDFAARTDIPVVGIVEFGVEAVLNSLVDPSASSVIVLGTATTTESGIHAHLLAQRGVPVSNIVSQGCPMMESEIQADPHSDMVSTMIDMYAVEAVGALPADIEGPPVVALCCSHYGYAFDTFRSVFRKLLGGDVLVVDPNTAMCEAMFSDASCRSDSAQVRVEVVSRASISLADVAAVAGMLQRRSRPTAEALSEYLHDTTLFSEPN